MIDYYATLGVPKTATDDEIKQAFRRQAMKHHPDRGGDSAKFQSINEAYTVLSDPQKREQYNNPPRPQPGFNPHMGGMNINDIFGAFGVNIRQQRMAPRINLWVSLELIAVGGPQVVALNVNGKSNQIEISVPRSIDDGDTIRYPGMSPDGQDLVITFRIHPNARWTREDKHLIVDQAVDLWDLVLGGTIAVTDIRGAELQMTLAAGTQPGSMLRLRGRGLPESDIPGKQGGPGDLLVRVGVRIPEQISPELVAAIRQERGH